MSDNAAVKWLWSKTQPLHKRIYAIVAGNIVFSASSVIFALVCRSIIDSATSQQTSDTVRYAIYLLGVIVLQFILRLCINGAEEYVRSGTGVLLRKDRLHELLKKDYSAVQSVHSGEWMNRLFSDVQVIADGVATILPSLMGMLTKLICAVAALVFLEPVFALIFVIGGAVLIVLTGVFRKKMKALHKEVQAKQGRVQAFLQETIENFLIVRVFRAEAASEQQCDELQNEHFKAQMKRRTFSIAANSGFSLVFQLGYLFALCWGARGLLYGLMTYGTLTAVLQLVGQIQGPIANLSGMLPRYYGVAASAERIMELNGFANEVQGEAENVGDLESISFSHVSFCYDRAQVLSDVSFDINAGDIVALTGLSGGGKSTIFLLLLGIYTAKGGDIYITAGGKRLAPCKSTRVLFTYVPQENGLFSGTIRDNMLMAKKDASDDEIMAALRIGCALEFINELPNGLDTVLGERGNGFSQGQRQRIAVARAVLSSAPVILLDEATSALDADTEQRVLANIAQLKNRTCFIVTHREAALHICSKQIVLKDGVTVSSTEKGE